jgi:hypothetical protein
MSRATTLTLFDAHLEPFAATLDTTSQTITISQGGLMVVFSLTDPLLAKLLARKVARRCVA